MKAPKRRALDIREEQIDAITVLHFSGDLDIKTLPKARAAIDALVGEKKAGKKAAKKDGPPNAIIDLEDVEYIDSSGLGFLIGTLKKLKERKGNLKLANLNAYMMGIFKLINMHYILEIHEGLDKALKSFSSPRRAAKANKE
jgi:anti-sigma B factor antagonist